MPIVIRIYNYLRTIGFLKISEAKAKSVEWTNTGFENEN